MEATAAVTTEINPVAAINETNTIPGEEVKVGDAAAEGEDEKPIPMYERYEYLDPRKWTPICTLKISLISP